MLHLIVNPTAGSGRAAKLLPRARAAFGETLASVAITTERGDERRLTREALAAGATTIVALGGDGTWSNVADELVSSGRPCPLALLAGGTGNDFAKSVGAPAHDFEAMARLVARRAERRVDVGEVEGRHFLNAVGFAFDVAAVQQADGMKWLRGPLRYVFASLPILFLYPGIAAAIDPPDERAAFAQHLALVIANGAHFGGSFRIAPSARIDDGQLDLLTISAPRGIASRLLVFSAAMRGAHIGTPGVATRTAPELHLRFRSPPIYEVDGELMQASSAAVTVRCEPGVLNVVADDES